MTILSWAVWSSKARIQALVSRFLIFGIFTPSTLYNWVQKSGCNGFCDDEIYGQAIHYYEEKDIEVGKPLNCQVSVNHHIELTEEEKAQARQEAIRQYQQEQMNKMRNRDTAKRTSQRTETEVHQPSLFDTL